MCSDKRYVGASHSFVRAENFLGRGGNGAVYEVQLVDDNRHVVTYPVVAKFFEYDGVEKDKRYSRFKNETEKLSMLKEINGVIKIIDMHCPDEIPKSKDTAWYLMPKAEEYKFNRRRAIYQKLNDMLSLAYTLKQLHEMGLAHRDIKPGNILILNENIVISDFGLVWSLEDERLTERDEKIGPYKIIPPELEHVQPDLNLNFKPSDIYLFAKVLWMNLKNDNIGFRGCYNRGDDQIYLDKSQYNVCTLEPIHKLIEQATREDMDQRITIDECIDYLLLQKCIFCDPKSLPEDQIKKLQYEEDSKRIVEKTSPAQYVYNKQTDIYDMLKSVIPNAHVFVERSNGVDNKRIDINKCTMMDDNTFCFLFYANGIKVNEYWVKVKNMVYKIKEETFVLELDDFKTKNPDRKQYGQGKSGLRMFPFKEYFSSNEKIVISKPCESVIL